MTKKPKPPDPELDAAIDAVAQGPGDEGRKRVLADLLLERGDPRGEFLLLQFLTSANQASSAMSQRMAELWRRHRHEWMKGVEQAFEDLKLENGFPVSGRVRLTMQAEVERELRRSPLITTLRHLEARSPPHAVFRDLVVDARLTRLESLVLDERGTFELVGQRGAPGRLKKLFARFVLMPADVTVLVAQPGYSALEELTFVTVDRTRVEDGGRLMEALDAHPTLDRVQQTGLPFGSMPAAIDAFARWPKLGFSRVGVPGTFELERGPDGASVMLQNLDDGELLRLRKLLPADVKRALLVRKRKGADRKEEVEKAWAGVSITWA